MLNFDLINTAGYDLWSDVESALVSERLARFTHAEWDALAQVLPKQTDVAQERVAQLLGDFDTVAAANILLPQAASHNRGLSLTAREALRGMSFAVVSQSASHQISTGQLSVNQEAKYTSINAILDAIEYRPRQSGRA